jgi:hypothetical protein
MFVWIFLGDLMDKQQNKDKQKQKPVNLTDLLKDVDNLPLIVVHNTEKDSK